MAFSPEQIRDALARSSKSAVTNLAREVLKFGSAFMSRSDYLDFERRIGLKAARRFLVERGISAMSKRRRLDSAAPQAGTRTDVGRDEHERPRKPAGPGP